MILVNLSWAVLTIFFFEEIFSEANPRPEGIPRPDEVSVHVYLTEFVRVVDACLLGRAHV
jgi:hypothetical protein